MVEWFKAAAANLAAFDIPEDEVAWFLSLMGAETAVRGNRGDSITEQAQDCKNDPIVSTATQWLTCSGCGERFQARDNEINRTSRQEPHVHWGW